MSVLIIFIKLIAVFDLLVIAVYFGGDILSTMLNKLRRKPKQDDPFDFSLDTVTVSLSIDSIRQLCSDDAADFVEEKILPNAEKTVVQQLSISDVDCPELFSSAEDEISYSQILGDLEQRYSEVKEPLRICGLSLGALLAIDFAIRHEEKVASLILIGAQYKVPSLLIDFQNLIFRCMPNKAFESMGLSKSSTIKLAHSMRSLDFTSQLNNIRCPVTILCGKKDTANLKASKRLKELLPKATLHIVPNAGHELNKYAPNTIAEILNN